MAAPTKYANYSTQEVLNMVEARRTYSPIIEELCQRLERFDQQCPVCEADLLDAFEGMDT